MGEVQIWGGVGQNLKFIDFDIPWDIFNKRKSSLGQKCAKREVLSLQRKIGTIAPDFPGQMTVFLISPYFSTLPSLKSGVSTHTKITFLK